jgi:hypothetical protein
LPCGCCGAPLAYRQQQRPYALSTDVKALELDAEQIRQLQSLGYVEGKDDEARRD